MNAYGTRGTPLQVTQKGRVKSLIWDTKGVVMEAEVTDAAANDIAYSSFEDETNVSWSIGSAVRIDTTARTGTKAYNLANGSVEKTGLTSQVYIVSFWAQSSSVRVNGNAATAIGSTIKGWTYFETKVSGTSVTISRSGTGNVLIDELRLYPEHARMVTYTYLPGVGVSSVTNENNYTEYYEYDAFGRLIFTKDQNGGIVKSYTYHYVSGNTGNGF